VFLQSRFLVRYPSVAPSGRGVLQLGSLGGSDPAVEAVTLQSGIEISGSSDPTVETAK